MTTADPTSIIDDLLNEPLQLHGWVIGPITQLDPARRECTVADRSGDTVTICYRPEDEPAVFTAFRERGEQSLKAFGLCEYQPDWVLTHMLRVERLEVVTHERAKRLKFFELWQEEQEMIDRSDWPQLPADLAENHDEYIAREILDA